MEASEAIALLDTALDALVVTDAKGSVVWLNRAAERTLGQERSEAIGRDAAELGVPDGPSAAYGEVTVVRSAGSPVRFAIWIREDQRLRTLIERAEQAAGLGSWDWDIERDELRWSDNLFRLFGLDPGAIRPTQEYVFEQTHPADRARVEREVAALISTGDMTPLEYRIIRADGSLAYLMATLAVAEEIEGRPTRVIGSVQDITARRRAEREVTAHLAVAVALDEWRSFDDGAVALLRGLAEALDYTAGALWVEEEERRLAPRAIWREVPSDSRLARRAWQERTPVDEGAAVAVPVITGGEVLAVIELSSRTEVAVTERLLETLTGIGYEVGQFLAHRRGELSAPVLTDRELQVLQLAARGNSGPRIAAELFLSPSTVKTHFENIYAKLGVSDRAAAVAYALRLGLIE